MKIILVVDWPFLRFIHLMGDEFEEDEDDRWVEIKPKVLFEQIEDA